MLRALRSAAVVLLTLPIAIGVASAQNITTVAGGYLGDDGPAVDAKLDGPRDIFVDAAGNVYIAEVSGHRIRHIDAATGEISTLAGGGDIGGVEADEVWAD